MQVSDEVVQFVTAVRSRVPLENDYVATKPQVTKLIIQLHGALVSKKSRKAVLSFIVGFPVASQKWLSGNYHSILIDLTTEGEHDDVLREIEALIETEALVEPWKAIPLPDGNEEASELSNLQSTDLIV